MSNMTVNSAPVRFTGAYASSMTKFEPEKKKLDFSNAVRIEFDERMPYEDGWQKLWGVETTETTADDGTVTKTISGSANIFGCNGYNYKGAASFSVSVSFDPANYEAGQLGDTIDLMSAAYEAQKQALRASFSGHELEAQTNQLEAEHQGRKDETAKSFSDMVGGFLEAHGQTGQVQKVYDSVQALFLSCESKYHSVAISHPNKWMTAGLYEAALNLQKLGTSVNSEIHRTDGLYTLRELELTAVGMRRGLNIYA